MTSEPQNISNGELILEEKKIEEKQNTVDSRTQKTFERLTESLKLAEMINRLFNKSL